MTLLAARHHPINCGLATTTSSSTFEKRAIADRKFDIVVTESRRVTASAGDSVVAVNKTGGTTAPHVKNLLRSSSATYVTDFFVDATVRGGNYFQPISLSSESTGVLSNPSTAGIATFQSVGQCTLRAESQDGEVAIAAVTTSMVTPSVVDRFHSWATGSLARHCTDQVNSLVAGKTQLNLYTDYQYYGTAQTNTFQRNSSCWANGIDMSCASPWNNAAGALYAGTLVSPRHVVFCHHANFFPPNGATMYFSSPSSVVISRTLTNTVKIPFTDIRIGVLNADVDSGVTFAKVLPTTFESYLPDLAGGYNGDPTKSTVPVMSLNQTERARIAGLYGLGHFYSLRRTDDYPAYYVPTILYDSGNPSFLVINGGPVLLGVFYDRGGGDHVAYHTTAINAAMTTLGGGYQLTPVDLSGFTTY